MFFAWIFVLIMGMLFIFTGKQTYKQNNGGQILVLLGWCLVIFDIILGFSMMSLS